MLILASSSPRRVHYMRALGLRFRSVAPDVDETRRSDESPRRYVRRLAVDKARTIAERHPAHWVVAADTTVVVDGSFLGKPKDARDARHMLRRLSGRAHRVLSGMALTRADASILESAVSSTRVFFRALSEREIRWYVATGEPLDKAGGYGVQNKGGLFVTRIEGSYSNVVGFPLETFYELFKACGLPLPT